MRLSGWLKGDVMTDEYDDTEKSPDVPAFGHGNPEQGGALGFTKRQYAAIKLKVPGSGLDWLDEMIIKARRDDLADDEIPF